VNRKEEQTFWLLYGLGLSVLLIVILLAYMFVWGNTPHLLGLFQG